MARDTTAMLAIDTGGTNRATMTMSGHRLYGTGHDYNVGTATMSSQAVDCHDNHVLLNTGCTEVVMTTTFSNRTFLGRHDNVLAHAVPKPP